MHDLVTWSCLSGNDAPFVSTFPARQPAPSLSALGIMPVSSYQRQVQSYQEQTTKHAVTLYQGLEHFLLCCCRGRFLRG